MIKALAFAMLLLAFLSEKGSFAWVKPLLQEKQSKTQIPEKIFFATDLSTTEVHDQ